MAYVLTNKQMREADGYTIGTLGIPATSLMARAGDALFQTAKEMLGGKENGRVLCVCGGGNNGGDGFVCARKLRAVGIETDVVFFAARSGAENAAEREEYLRVGGKTYETVPEREYALVVDCLLGTGFHGKLSPEYAAAIQAINGQRKKGAKVLAADIPSGVNGDNGRAELAVLADKTLCIGERKAGVLLGEGIDCAGEVVCADIGIFLPEARETYATLSDGAEISALLPKRKRNTHKGSYGRAAIVAGSAEYTGAAYLATAACLRAGAGYTALFAPKELLPHFVLKAPEALLVPLNEGDRVAFTEEHFERLLPYDSIAYGMGAGVSEDVAKGAEYLLRNYTGKLILDADALNSLSAYSDIPRVFADKKCGVAITPHVKEFSRLTGESVQTILESGLDLPKAFAKAHGCTVLLKGAASVIADGTHTVVNTAGTAGQAKGGSGDVLSGVLAGLCASGLSVFDGARAGAYLTGRAAELAAKEFGEYSLLASDVIAYLGKAFLSVAENSDKYRNEE